MFCGVKVRLLYLLSSGFLLEPQQPSSGRKDDPQSRRQADLRLGQHYFLFLIKLNEDWYAFNENVGNKQNHWSVRCMLKQSTFLRQYDLLLHFLKFSQFLKGRKQDSK